MFSHMYSVVDIGKQYVKSKFKVCHTISVHVVYFCYILEVVGYIIAISSYMYSIFDVKSKFKVFIRFRYFFGCFPYMSEV